ncbi:hypothetical protein MSAN_00812500 [Mycena sanguinolenta]|uniref:Transmembrane protein n=1 Tax=Mycena sanguinolenta TaxID=230812 RepID=A0A8H7DDF2_9AGAR|nr:hypothetical protein MSAN_00812500 [Mycena sanguinolenta]
MPGSMAMDSSPPPDPTALQGTAMAALIWVAYDLSLTLDREIQSILLVALEMLVSAPTIQQSLCISILLPGNTGSYSIFCHLDLATYRPALRGRHLFAHAQSKSLKIPLSSNVMIGRIYIATTEILCVLAGEALILLRINALYGWDRKWVVFTVFLFFSEAVVGIVTTTITLRGGSAGLSGSTEILNCSTTPKNLPDVNIGMWCTSLFVVCVYFTMIFRMIRTLAIENGKSVWQILWAADLLPTIHICLRDACAYFLVVFVVLLMNLVLLTAKLGYAQIGTPWLISTYTVASTRIFLNLKYLSQRSSQYNSATWSEFERASVLDFRETGTEHLSRPGP